VPNEGRGVFKGGKEIADDDIELFNDHNTLTYQAS
jgi:hypothetical protein